MPEEIKTAQTSEQTSQGGAAAAAEEKEGTSAEFTDSELSPSGEGKEGEQDDGAKNAEDAQSKEKNREFARARREAERKRELERVRYEAIKEALGKNPYTGQPITDAEDVEEYLVMKEISDKGGDPVADYSTHIKEKKRETAKSAAEEKRTKEWYENDRKAFEDKYPDVKFDELIKNERFADYADGKVGKKPISDIYEGFLKFEGKDSAATAGKKAQEIAAQMVANKRASVGALGTPGGAEDGFLTREDVAKMSVAECEKNYDKIIKSMPRWK